MRMLDLFDPALDAEIANLIENASAGATGAASVATCAGTLGGLGAGFDPAGDWGVYPKPKKRKTVSKTSVLRRAPISEVTGNHAYPRRSFMLPTSVLDLYDDPEYGAGDDGYTIDELVDAIGRDGQTMEIMIGFSLHEIEHNDDHKVYVFNGNHRLAACRKLGVAEMMCMNSPADDAEPLTVDQIIALGGRLI